MILGDSYFIIEAVVILIIILAQLGVFFSNNSTIRKIKKIFPAGHKLGFEYTNFHKENNTGTDEDTAIIEANKIALLKKDNTYSETFNEIVESTNNYIIRNKGAANIVDLQDIAERKSKSMEDSIDTSIAFPLYLGLLGTFSGVIIGLIKIANAGVSDAAIQSFIGGVLIGMIASAFGLLLTVRSNHIYKEAKKDRDNDLYEYLNFVRINLISRSYKALPVDMRKLQYQLSAFTEEFTSYQHNLSASLGNTLKRFEELQEVMEGIKGLEPGLKHIAQTIRDNNDLVIKQSETIGTITSRTANMTQEIDEHLVKVDGKIQQLALSENGNQAYFYEESRDVNKAILTKLEEAETSNKQIAAHIGNLYSFLQKSLDNADSGNGSFLNSFSFRLFTFLGTILFIMGITLGIWYITNEILPLYM